jgi:hypothetical protein
MSHPQPFVDVINIKVLAGGLSVTGGKPSSGFVTSLSALFRPTCYACVCVCVCVCVGQFTQRVVVTSRPDVEAADWSRTGHTPTRSLVSVSC